MGLGQAGTDLNSSINALKQLTRRTRVNLIYDPKKNFMKEFTPKKSISEQSLIAPETVELVKTRSHHPAFAQLRDHSPEAKVQHSKVYVKRNFLYGELKHVLISVEQCASLWLLEDFLRNKIKTLDDVKALKVPSTFFGGQL